MENLSITFRHCYYTSLFLHQPHRKYLLKNHSSSSRFSLGVKHASFESTPISISLESYSSNWNHFHPIKELSRCSNDLVSVKAIHARMIKLFEQFDLELISRYLQFGELGYASALFFLGSQVSWKEFSEEIKNFGLEKNRVLEEFVKLQNKGINFDGLVLVTVLKICTVLTNRILGLIIHSCLIKRGLINDSGTALLNFYGRCVSSDIANKMFDEMPQRDDLIWNEIVMVNLRSGNWEKALKLFREMQITSSSGVKKVYDGTIVKLLQACSNNGGLVQGREIHGYVIRFGFESNVSVCNSLIVMYSRNGNLESSRKVFDSMKDQDRNLSSWNSIISSYTSSGYIDEAIALLEAMEKSLKPDIVTWNSLLSGYALKRGFSKDAIEILNRMQTAGLKPNASSVISLLQAIAEPKNLKLGKASHGYVIRNQLSYNVYVETTLIDMYVKASSLLYAKMVFDMMDAKKKNVAYNSLISGLSCKEAEDLVIKMEKEGIKPDSVTWNNLVFVYSSFGKTEEALGVIEKMKKNGFEPNVVTWTAVLSGCCKNENFKDALKVFAKMLQEGIEPNSATISALLKMITSLRLLENGKEVHCFTLKNDLIQDSYVATAVLDMYAKSGDLESAVKVFQSEPKPLASWNCMIMGLAMFGKGKEGIRVFDSMIESGVKPDSITFTSVLSLCKNAGFVDEGWKYFDLMKDRFGLAPSIEHCSCMVELLGKSGFLDEAWDFIQSMPRVIKPDAAIYGVFLASCKIHKEIELAEMVWKKVKSIEPEIYSELNRFSMKFHNVRRVLNVWSWIRVDKTVRFFNAGGKSRFDEGEIYFELYKLVSEMTELGYVPEKLLMGHTEKLAMTYGLIKKKGLGPIRVVKNSSICSDCHDVAKFMSVLRNREIYLLEGGGRIHRFRDGKCSCNDFW